MPTPIESATVGGEIYTVGQRVCIAGRGTAAPVHIHGTIQRFTATMMIVEYTRRGEKTTRRYQTGRGHGREVGAHEYGGSYVAPRCQRPKSQE